MNVNTLFARILVIPFLTISMNSFADESAAMWKSLKSQTQINRITEGKTVSLPLKTRTLSLDEPSLKALLEENVSVENNTIVLPMPDGTEVTFQITPNNLMPEALSEKFPDIKTWKVKSIEGDIAGVIDFTHHGFHGMLFMPNGDRVFIEPNIEESTTGKRELSTDGNYVSFSQQQNTESFQTEFSCGLHNNNSSLNFSTSNDGTSSFNTAARTTSLAQRFLTTPPSTLITYRLAVATTGEYTRFYGGTVAAALSGVVTTMSRVNEIYIRDFGIQFELIEQQADIIYTNRFTDPYTSNDVFALIDENGENLSDDGDLSQDEYDIGHVFTAENIGGLAVVGGVCIDDEKAYGATGISSPFGDAFAINYVAHELGHQLGATHTFNSLCESNERTGVSAVEPGSGTTIMSYAGICGDDNIQFSPDAQFHIVSIDQINFLTRSDSGARCGTSINRINENPTVDAGEDFIVPARTPIKLEATGFDADTDNDLTYSWEQIDTGTPSALNIDTGDNAIFRSRPLSSNNIRYIPRLEDLFAGTFSDGELLPITNRDINMVATVRDGLGGLEGDDLTIEVVDTGEIFAITSNTVNQSFGRQDLVDMTWEVADTDLSPIFCSTVDIGVITSDGTEFTMLSTANDGEEQFSIPSDTPVMDNARFILSCSDSNFFNVSTGEITILDQIGDGEVLSNISNPAVDFGADEFNGVINSSSDSDSGGSNTLFIILLGLLIFVIQQRQPSKIRVKVRAKDK